MAKGEPVKDFPKNSLLSSFTITSYCALNFCKEKLHFEDSMTDMFPILMEPRFQELIHLVRLWGSMYSYKHSQGPPRFGCVDI